MRERTVGAGESPRDEATDGVTWRGTGAGAGCVWADVAAATLLALLDLGGVCESLPDEPDVCCWLLPPLVLFLPGACPALRTKSPLTNWSSVPGLMAHRHPLPGLSGPRAVLIKHGLSERLCRIEFCHPASPFLKNGYVCMIQT